MPRLPRSRLLLLLLAVLTVPGYLVLVVHAALVMCGISGCRGGGFGPSFAPGETQFALVLAGLGLVPLTVVALRRRPVAVRAGAAAVAIVTGALLAMVLIGAGPHGCPVDRARTTTGPGSSSPGSATCSERHVVRRLTATATVTDEVSDPRGAHAA